MAFHVFSLNDNNNNDKICQWQFEKRKEKIFIVLFSKYLCHHEASVCELQDIFDFTLLKETKTLVFRWESTDIIATQLSLPSRKGERVNRTKKEIYIGLIAPLQHWSAKSAFFLSFTWLESNISYDVSSAAPFIIFLFLLFFLQRFYYFFFSMAIFHFFLIVYIYRHYLTLWVLWIIWPRMNPYWDIFKPKSPKILIFLEITI